MCYINPHLPLPTVDPVSGIAGVSGLKVLTDNWAGQRKVVWYGLITHKQCTWLSVKFLSQTWSRYAKQEQFIFQICNSNLWGTVRWPGWVIYKGHIMSTLRCWLGMCYSKLSALVSVSEDKRQYWNGTLKFKKKQKLSKGVVCPPRLNAFNITCMCVQGGPDKVRPTYIFDGNIWMHR